MAAIDADMQRLMGAAAVPGLALALIEDGKVVYQRAYGEATPVVTAGCGG